MALTGSQGRYTPEQIRENMGEMSLDEFLLNVTDARGVPLFGGDSTMMLRHISVVATQIAAFYAHAQEKAPVDSPMTLVDFLYVREHIGNSLAGNDGIFNEGIEPTDYMAAERLMLIGAVDTKKILEARK